MKRFLALFTALVLMTGIIFVPGVSFAEEKTTITLKQAIEIAKSTLGINTEGFEFNSSYNENQNGYNIWNLSWNNTKTNSENIYVSVDADTGKIVAMGWWTPYEQVKSRIPKHTKAEAQKAAEEFAAKLQGECFKQTRLNEDYNSNYYYDKFSDVYSFTFTRVHDGLDVPSDNIMVQLDKNTLKVRNFSISWDKGSLPSKAKAFDLDKAKQLFKEKIGLELTYNLVYGNQNNQPDVILAYTLKNGNRPIDAITGELLNSYNIMPYYMDKVGAPAAAEESVVITPEEQSELEKSSKYISKAEAEQAIRQFISIDEKMKLERANLYPGYHKQNATWNLEWRNAEAEGNTYKYLSAQIDAVTKEFLSFNIYDSSYNQGSGKNTIDKEQARKLAEEFLKKVQPEKFAKTQYREYKEQFDYAPINSNYFNFNFARVENGIPCPTNSLTVSVSGITGEIVSFNTSWMNLKFPAAEKTITLDKAYDVLFDKVKFEMQYVQHFKNMNNYDSKEIRLAYGLENMPILISANNGIMLNYDGKPVTPVQKQKYTDIKGNKAEDEINLLIEMGIIEPDSTTFMPDSKMLQKDFIKLLVNSLQPQYYIGPVAKDASQYDNYYSEAIRRKILSEADKNPEATVTRQDAAKMIIRAMGYGAVAEKSSMFATNFKDAAKLTTAYKGYAVMASELGIVPAADSFFNPITEVTKGDTAEFIVNYLKCETSL